MEPSNTALGLSLEEDVAERLGGVVHEGSGNQPLVKLDVRGASLVVSCKATRGHSVSITESTLDEARRAVHGPGGFGGGYLPAWAAKTKSDRVYITMEAEDFSDLFTREDVPTIPTDKTRQRTRQSTTPSLMREDPKAVGVLYE